MLLREGLRTQVIVFLTTTAGAGLVALPLLFSTLLLVLPNRY